ncbi:MAG: Holliday junction resolvase RuvX [Candidatus Schekmanbacteria bacterium]|nr:Holliday junction resolvase RuvX [Candidatus Schekmanbacteria bacterium]
MEGDWDAPPAVPGRVLALDLGSVRVGVAVSDPSRRMAFPRDVLRRHPEAQLLGRLASMVSDEDVALVVVGLPLHLSGAASSGSRDAESFAGRLRERIAVPVQMCDERLTTVDAEALLLEGDTTRRRRRGVRDKVAATLLLESFLRESEQGG